MPAPFEWRDGERTIRYGRGALADAPRLLGEGYALLTTARAEASAPEVAERAASTVHVPAGQVTELTVRLRDDVPPAPLLVALGGGRVVDVAKAIAALRGDGTRVASIPTTLSAAEMTRIHRLPDDAPPGTRRVRPAIVVNDPALCASQPRADLAASAANSLGHAVEAPVTEAASPVPTLAALEAVRLTEHAYEGRGADDDPDRDALALAALLSGYAIDGAGYGLHHVLSQTLVRVGGVAHGPANAAMLPHSLEALRQRAGYRLPAGAEQLARDLAKRAGATSLDALGVAPEALDACADAAARRAELDHTPPRADRDELRALYEAAR